MRSHLLAVFVGLALTMALGSGCGSSGGGAGGSAGADGAGGGGSQGSPDSGADGWCFTVSKFLGHTTCGSVKYVPTQACDDGNKSGQCPAAGLFGCCTRVTKIGDDSTTALDCYYDSSQGGLGKADCMGTGQSWSTDLP
jgi:hypothetical protein